jgi:small-conductance mechanosensitive channel
MAVLIVDILVAAMTLWWLFEICKKKISNLHSIIHFTISKSDEAQQHVKNYPSTQLLSIHSTSTNPSIR